MVVTGLKPAKDMSDSELFGNLILENLKIKTTPLQCKWIGKLFADKIQPLLIVLPSTDVSEEIISKAKMLRKSESVYTSQHVYINRYLTKFESKAVYELRQQRRARELNRNNKDQEVNKSAKSTSIDEAIGNPAQWWKVPETWLEESIPDSSLLDGSC